MLRHYPRVPKDEGKGELAILTISGVARNFSIGDFQFFLYGKIIGGGGGVSVFFLKNPSKLKNF